LDHIFFSLCCQDIKTLICLDLAKFYRVEA